MSNTNDKAKAAYAVRKIAEALRDTVVESGPAGVPEGILYASLMGFGCSLQQFNSLIDGMVSLGWVKKQGNLLLPA